MRDSEVAVLVFRCTAEVVALVRPPLRLDSCTHATVVVLALWGRGTARAVQNEGSFGISHVLTTMVTLI